MLKGGGKVDKPKVSIVIPVYNVEKYLERCLESLISQTLQDIEIIVVNDGSTDKSLTIINNFIERDSRIKVIDKENTGVSHSRNIAINAAQGEYLAFVDSDDWIDNDMLEHMYKQAKEEDLDIVMCTYMREFVTHSKEKTFNSPEVEVYKKEDILNLHRKLIGPINDELGNPESLDSLGTVWGKLYRLDPIKNNNVTFEDLKIIGSNEDSLFNIHAFKYINKAAFINKPFYHYWKGNSKSITSRYNPHLKGQWLNLFEKIHYFIEENELDISYKVALKNRICMSVLGLGLNECSKENMSSTLSKIKKMESILSEKIIREAYESFDINKFPIHWRLFYCFNKYKISLLSFCMLNTIEFLRTRV